MRHWHHAVTTRQRGIRQEAAGVMGGVIMLPSPTALVAIVPVFHAMSTRQAAVAAALAGGAFLAVFLLKRLRSNAVTIASDGHQRRMTLEELLQDQDVTVKPIGTVRSIYRLCVGTPRQGLLAPHARGRLELDVISPDAVLGLDGFSHIWIVFVFHLNTVSKSQRAPSKIAPPALGGKKVGVFCTRSPHRMNPIGMTLCKLESIILPSKGSSTTVLNVSGLDLVDGTPIIDIKPYVPHYDAVPSEDVRLPSWVSGGLATRRPVHVESQALDQLEAILAQDPNALDFYGAAVGDVSMQETVEAATHCIAEVLSIDVRSKWQTGKARESKFQAERAGRLKEVLSDDVSAQDSEQCTQQLDNLLVSYTVEAPEQHERSTSEGSGAEDVVHVKSIQLLKRSGTSKDDADTSMEDATTAFTDATLCTASSGAQTPAKKSSRQPTVNDNSPAGTPPTDADYKSLKTYWSHAASKNTPTGLNPEEVLSRQQSRKFFTFSARPKPTTPDGKAYLEDSKYNLPKSGAVIHLMDEQS